MMFKKKTASQENYRQHVQNDDTNSQKIKLSSRQKLAKIFLISDIKNPKLWKSMRSAKSELLQNFHDGGVDIDKVNTLFWIYFHDHKDVFIPKYLKGFTNKCLVFADRFGNDTTISLFEYLKLLKKIRVQIEPFIKEIQQLLDIAKEYARKKIDSETLDVYSLYDKEYYMENYHMVVKQTFNNLLLEKFDATKLYTEERFCSLCDSISTSWQDNEYKDLILFSIFGMHYFDKKSMVYGAFTSEQLASPLSFSLGSQKHSKPLTIILGEFLAIIEQLNFKKHFFDL